MSDYRSSSIKNVSRAALIALLLLCNHAAYAEDLATEALQTEWFSPTLSLSESLSESLQGSYQFETLAESPTSVSSAPWKKFPYVLGATAILYAYDEDIQAWVQRNRTPTTNRIAYYAKHLGDLKFVVRPLGALFAYGVLADDERARDTAVWSAEGIAVAGVATQIMKYSVRRPRPSDEPAEDPFGLPDVGVSFPSGHATVSFAIATVVASQYPRASGAAYSAAALTAWSRVNDNVHWASDIVFGAFVGYISSKTILRYERLADAPPEMQSAQASPLQIQFRY